MRFVGLLLILGGLLVGYELAYRGKTIQQVGSDLAAFFHASQGGGSAASGWTGQQSPGSSGPSAGPGSTGAVLNGSPADPNGGASAGNVGP